MAEVFDLLDTDASNTGRWPEGMLGGDINNAGRADEGMLARHYHDHDGSRTASGSSNAFAVTPVRTIAALFDNLTQVFTANHTITGAATLNLSGLGAKSIKRFNGSELTAGDIVSGLPVWVIYKLATDTWYMVSAAAALFANMHADFNENGSPGSPAADVVRVFAFDDGGGITVLGQRTAADGFTRALLARALQAEVEAATSLNYAAPVGRQHFHPGHPKAQGRGAAAGGIAGTSYNVASIVRNSTGTYTVTLTNAMSSTNYLVLSTALTNNVRIGITIEITSATTFVVRIFSTSSGDAADLDFGFAVFGDM